MGSGMPPAREPRSFLGHPRKFVRSPERIFADEPEDLPLPPGGVMTVRPSVEKARMDLLERIKRARSRRTSQLTTPGLLETKATTVRPALTDLLG